MLVPDWALLAGLGLRACRMYAIFGPLLGAKVGLFGLMLIPFELAPTRFGRILTNFGRLARDWPRPARARLFCPIRPKLGRYLVEQNKTETSDACPAQVPARWITRAVWPASYARHEQGTRVPGCGDTQGGSLPQHSIHQVSERVGSKTFWARHDGPTKA